MNLTAYSDSESEGDQPAAEAAPKPAFHRVGGRIKLNVPSLHHDVAHEPPPAKKPRLGGFNAMLPAPKRPAASPAPPKRALGKGLAAGVNLKTAAEPAFRREPRAHSDEHHDNGTKDPMHQDDFRAMLNLPPPKTAALEAKPASPTDPVTVEPPPQPPPPEPALPRFVPMSVAKGKKKKKPVAPRPAAPKASDLPLAAPQPAPTESKPPRKPRVSLFGVSSDTPAPANALPDGQYRPLLYGIEDEELASAPVPNDTFDPHATDHASDHAPTKADGPAPNHLANIASALNLSEAERRQLFGNKGRTRPNVSSTKIVEFNTDTEYAHNERVRQQGEQVQHNALKSISGTGKNSLRSLVTQATSQKDALEDHFAAGHRNKREAGNRYGW